MDRIHCSIRRFGSLVVDVLNSVDIDRNERGRVYCLFSSQYSLCSLPLYVPLKYYDRAVADIAKLSLSNGASKDTPLFGSHDPR